MHQSELRWICPQCNIDFVWLFLVLQVVMPILNIDIFLPFIPLLNRWYISNVLRNWLILFTTLIPVDGFGHHTNYGWARVFSIVSSPFPKGDQGPSPFSKGGLRGILSPIARKTRFLDRNRHLWKMFDFVQVQGRRPDVSGLAAGIHWVFRG